MQGKSFIFFGFQFHFRIRHYERPKNEAEFELNGVSDRLYILHYCFLFLNATVRNSAVRIVMNNRLEVMSKEALFACNILAFACSKRDIRDLFEGTYYLCIY
jgi:hypothetical protein